LIPGKELWELHIGNCHQHTQNGALIFVLPRSTEVHIEPGEELPMLSKTTSWRPRLFRLLTTACFLITASVGKTGNAVPKPGKRAFQNAHQEKVKAFAHFEKVTVIATSRATGHFDRHSTISVSIQNVPSLNQPSPIFIFDKMSREGNATSISSPVEIFCPKSKLRLQSSVLSSFLNAGGGELPALQLIQKISKTRGQCGPHRTTVSAFIFKNMIGMSSKQFDALDNELESGCSISSLNIQGIGGSLGFSQLSLIRTSKICSKRKGTPRENRNEIEIAAALGAHERSISEQDNGFFLSEWIGASTKKNVDFHEKNKDDFSKKHRKSKGRRRLLRTIGAEEGRETMRAQNTTRQNDSSKIPPHFDEIRTLNAAASRLLDVVSPVMNKYAYPLLEGSSKGDDSGHPYGQGDDLTPREYSDVFLLNGPVWSALDRKAKESVMRASRERSTTLSFIETTTRTDSYVRAGVTSKAILSEVVNKVSKLMPEHITQLITSFFRDGFVIHTGHFMQQTWGEDLLPSSRSTPDVNLITGHGAGVMFGDAGIANLNMPAYTGGAQGNIFRSGRILQLMNVHMSDRVRQGVESQVDETLISGFVETINARMGADKHAIHMALHRAMLPGMSKMGTEKVIESGEGPMVRATSSETIRHLTGALIPALTQSLAPTLTHALKHSARSDYYCHYCREAKLYCGFCRSSKIADWEQDYYTSYYAGYYSAYYTPYYANSIAKRYIRDATKRVINPQVSESGRERPELGPDMTADSEGKSSASAESMVSHNGPAVNCEGKFKDWSKCSSKTGCGTQTKEYVISTPASNGGIPCPNSPMSRPCGTCKAQTNTKTHESTGPRDCDGADLWAKALNHPEITINSFHPSGKKDNANGKAEAEAAARGLRVSRSSYEGAPGGVTCLEKGMAQFLLALADEIGQVTVNEIAGGSHSRTSSHYAGHAIDIGKVSGRTMNSKNPHLRRTVELCKTYGANWACTADKSFTKCSSHSTWTHCQWNKVSRCTAAIL
jgi:hypothetical protein